MDQKPLKISDFDGDLKFTDFENFLNVFEDQRTPGKPYQYNLNSTIYFVGLPQDVHDVKHDSFWTTLSYEIYGTTRLWWALMKVNDVGPDQAFEPVRAGSRIRCLSHEAVDALVKELL